MCTTQVNIKFDIFDRLLIEFNIQSERFESNFLPQSIRNECFFNNKKIYSSFFWIMLLVF